jgi:dTMP kinase
MIRPGKFITLEGGEGVGKSTNLAVIESYLAENDVEYIVTREPGGTHLAEKIRDLILDNHDEPMDAATELLLVFAARAQHLNTKIRPAITKGKWVLCDRFTDATYAYQGAGRELGERFISALEDLVQGELRPDLTVILDLEPATGLNRASQRGALDRIEQEQIDFFHRVRTCYLEIAAANPQRCALIDASKPLPAVRHQLLETLEQRLRIFLDER